MRFFLVSFDFNVSVVKGGQLAGKGVPLMVAA